MSNVTTADGWPEPRACAIAGTARFRKPRRFNAPVNWSVTLSRESSARALSRSRHPESIGEHGEFCEHGSEPLDQRQQPRLRHVGDQIVKHTALPEQRVSAPFGGV